jgi:hypothetical protein
VLVSVGTGRFASAMLMREVLERQSKWRLASCIWSCLCGLWIAAEAMLATIACAYDQTQSRFVCPVEVSPRSESSKRRVRRLTTKQASRWLGITTVDICLEVCLVGLWNILIWCLQLPWTKRLRLCATSSSRLL